MAPRAEGWSYSSTGAVLSALFAEEVTGQDIGRLITRRIIKPLKLTGTYRPDATDDGRRVTLAANQHPSEAKAFQPAVVPQLLCALR
ncbi:serine hydrolase [Planomonospora venezuelensis]|uniref:CubicO group peptidase (Beta-lactamase class C family) n=1 Tax=Planomonospora venezuelensis TaxID=1999 RepID=A0A841CYY0_PLAVE|nr:CubicO group peptidase (beta-lactamase class C family) [Planomonospora venezuelensis]GIM99099.1 hypothetical protein Pve01_07580 [Planomonospora venezuelensis]